MLNKLLQLATNLGTLKSLKSLNNFYYESVRENKYSKSFSLSVPIKCIHIPADK